jgi:hypothetical protein
MSLLATLSQDEPDGTLTPPQQALWWLAKGDYKLGPEWERAHEICQTAEGERDHDLVHALAHLIEGDRFNSDYWYRRAGSKRTHDDPADEWQAVAANLGASLRR